MKGINIQDFKLVKNSKDIKNENIKSVVMYVNDNWKYSNPTNTLGHSLIFEVNKESIRSNHLSFGHFLEKLLIEIRGENTELLNLKDWDFIQKYDKKSDAKGKVTILVYSQHLINEDIDMQRYNETYYYVKQNKIVATKFLHTTWDEMMFGKRTRC